MSKKTGLFSLREQTHKRVFKGILHIEVEEVDDEKLDIVVYDTTNFYKKWLDTFLFGARVFHYAYGMKYKKSLHIDILGWEWLPTHTTDSLAAFAMIKALEDALDFKISNVEIQIEENRIIIPIFPEIKFS